MRSAPSTLTSSLPPSLTWQPYGCASSCGALVLELHRASPAERQEREAKEETEVLETVVEKKGTTEGWLVVRAEPLEQAQRICNNLVEGVRVVEGALLVEADQAWAKAINAVLIERGVRVSELYPSPREEKHMAAA